MNYTLSDFTELNKKFGEKMETCFGPTLLSYPEDADGCRMLMAAQNFKQFITLKEPDVARVQTGHENIFGRLSQGYKKINGKWEVVAKINKFSTGEVYTLVLYNKESNTYDMLEKHVAENLTEKYGYVYNTERMDSLKPGDVIEDEVIYRSTSYDKNMNYRIGKSARCTYTVDNEIIEDAIKISKSFADKVISYEIDSAEIMINANDFPLLIHGDENDRHTIPRIGETIPDGIICSINRLNKNHLLYDMKEEHLISLNDKAVSLKVSPGSYIYDMEIYYNGDDPFPDNVFYHDLKSYYDQICNYKQEIFEWTTKIKESGAKYTEAVGRMRHESKNFNNPEYKWKDRDSVFNNIKVVFSTIKEASLKNGYKLTGRYGDKGVISKICTDVDENDNSDGTYTIRADDKSEDVQRIFKVLNADIADKFDVKDFNPRRINIVDDEHMPYTSDGKRIDIIFDLSGSVRRINFGQITEVDINFMSERIRQHMCKVSYDEAMNIAFKYLRMLRQAGTITYISKFAIEVDGTEEQLLKSIDPKFKHDFVDSIRKDGFYIIKPCHSEIRYDTIKAIYEEFKDICPKYQLYIDRFGIKGKKVMLPAVVGEKQIMVLKQTSTKNFSSRSMARVTKSGLPAKSADKKENRKFYADTPVTISEIGAIAPSVEMMDFAKYSAFVRTSPIARKALKRTLLAKEDPLIIRDLPMLETYENVAVQNFQARLKVMGIRINMITDKTITESTLNNYATLFDTFGYTFCDYLKNKKYYTAIISRYKDLIRSGAPKLSDDTWNSLMESEAMQIIDPPKDIVSIVRTAITYDEEMHMDAKEEENETNGQLTTDESSTIAS